MAAVARYLADTSALARLHRPAVSAVLAPLIESGVVATTRGLIEFELAWATRSTAEFDQLRTDRGAGYEWLATHDEDWRRALEVQAALWRSGRMRAVGLPDLLMQPSPSVNASPYCTMTAITTSSPKSSASRCNGSYLAEQYHNHRSAQSAVT